MARRYISVLSVLLLTVASVVAMASPAHAALGLRENADAQPWMTNGIVYDQALSEDGKTLYIGGKFTQVRATPVGTPGQSFSVAGVAAIDVATGAPVRTWNPRVTSNDGTTPIVRSLAVKDGRVYIGGQFTTVGGQPRRNLAAVDASTGAVVGSFTATVGDNTSVVNALVANASRLYVGGKFTRVNGTGRGNLAALDLSSGDLDTAWRARANGLVRELEFGPNDDGTIFAVGAFNAVSSGNSGNIARQSVARFVAATSAVHPWAVPSGQIQTDSGRNNNMTCWDATVTPARLYLNCGLGPNYSAAFRLDNGNSGDRVWQRGFGGNPQTSAMSPDGSRLIVGGHFGINPIKQQVCGKPLGGLVALNPVNGQIDCSSNWVPHLDQNTDPAYDGAWTVLSTDQHVWVGGRFVGVSGEPRTNLARFTYDPALKIVNAAPRVDLDGLRRGGLDATYFDNTGFTGAQISRTDPTVDFNWGNGSPDPAIGQDTFSARWSGQVEAPVNGNYTFTTNSDDGVRLFVDGRLVIDNWTDHGPTDDSAVVTLEAGKRYDVQLDFYESGGGAVARLHWSYPGQGRQAIPANSLFSSGSKGYQATFTAGAGPAPIVDPNNLEAMDADDPNLRSATVKLLDNPDGGSESLSADTAGSTIAASYDDQTGTLSLTGPASKGAFRQVLRTVAYDNACTNPAAGERRVTFVVNDGSIDSETATSAIAVRGADGQPPTGECSAPGGGGDTTAPSVQSLTQDLSLPNSSLHTSLVPVKAVWAATDDEGEIVSYDLQYSRDGGAFQTEALDPATKTAENVQMRPDSEYRFRVRATDSAGNTSEWTEGQPFTVKVAQEESHGVLGYSDGWTEESLTSAFGGSTRHSNQAGASASFTFTGSDVIWAAQRGPDRGRAEVWLDGVKVETIDLYASSEQPRRVLYSAALDSGGTHTLEVRVLDTKRAASTDTRVDVDAFVALQ